MNSVLNVKAQLWDRHHFPCGVSRGANFWGTLMKGFKLILCCSWTKKYIHLDSSRNSKFQHREAVSASTGTPLEQWGIWLMGFLQNQNMTLSISQPEVIHWESTQHLSSAVNNTIILLGALTFALQLCLSLFFMLRCWRFDNRVRKALKHPGPVKLIDIYKQTSYQLCDHDAAASSPAVSVAVEEYEPVTNSLFAPSIPWDLVQRWQAPDPPGIYQK